MLKLFAFSSPLFFTVGEFQPKCAAHKTRYSVLVSLRWTRIFWDHLCRLLAFGCFPIEFFEMPLPWQGST